MEKMSGGRLGPELCVKGSQIERQRANALSRATLFGFRQTHTLLFGIIQCRQLPICGLIRRMG